MALTRNGNYIGRAAQLDKADARNEMWSRVLNPTDEERERIKRESEEAKEQMINEIICITLAPHEYERIRGITSRKHYRKELCDLAERLEAESRADERERRDLYAAGMGA
jgi:hypothetical protein